MNVINIGVLTISDRCARGEAVDESGPTVVGRVGAGIVKNGTVVRTGVVPDCKDHIEEVLKRWCDDDNLHLILTTGGTGLSERDVTPEATAAVLEKTVPGIPHLMFQHSSAVTPLAALSRAIAGIRGRSLIINLPGSKKASRECLEAVAGVIPHAIDVIHERKKEVGEVHSGKKKKKSSVIAGNAANRIRESQFPCIPVDKAQQIVIETVSLLRKEKTVSYEQALDHVLAQEVIAGDNLPSFDVSLKDGYAVKSSNNNRIRSRTVIGVCKTGEEPPDVMVGPESCMRVSTGGPIPWGADAVVAVEKTTLESLNDERNEETRISLLHFPGSGEEIRKKGSDFSAGQIVMKWGTYLNSAAVGFLAAVGVTSVRVYRKPMVAVMSTGNEVSDPQTDLKPGKVRDSNRIMLLSMLKEENFETVDLGIIPDDPDCLRDSLEKGFLMADIVVTTGSMSMGERDFLKEVIVSDFNGNICFGRVFVKPGKPTAFGMVDFEGKPKLWFGIPGNPGSAFVCSHLFLLPSLRKISGHEDVFPQTVNVSFQGTFPREERPQYIRGIAKLVQNKYTVTPTKNQRSSCLESCVKANCLIFVPAASTNHYQSSGNETFKALLLGKPYI